MNYGHCSLYCSFERNCTSAIYGNWLALRKIKLAVVELGEVTSMLKGFSIIIRNIFSSIQLSLNIITAEVSKTYRGKSN